MKIIIFLVAAFVCFGQMPFPGPGMAHAVSSGGQTPTYKGGNAQNINSADLTISSVATLNVAAGDLVIVLLSGSNTADTPSVVCGSDSLSLAKTETASSYRADVWYKENASANAAATCTATWSNQSDWRSITAVNYSGVATSGSLVYSSCNSATCNALAASSTSRTAQNVTTGAPNASALLIGCGIDWDGDVTHTLANSYNKRINGTTPFLLDKNVTSTGTYPSGNFSTVGSAQQYMSFFLVFKAGS